MPAVDPGSRQRSLRIRQCAASGPAPCPFGEQQIADQPRLELLRRRLRPQVVDLHGIGFEVEQLAVCPLEIKLSLQRLSTQVFRWMVSGSWRFSTTTWSRAVSRSPCRHRVIDPVIEAGPGIPAARRDDGVKSTSDCGEPESLPAGTPARRDRCEDCGASRAVAFSCRKRGFCPSQRTCVAAGAWPIRRRAWWTTLLARVFSSDFSECKTCGGRLRIIAALTDPTSIRTYLEGVGLPAMPPALPPALALRGVAGPLAVRSAP